MEDTQGQTDALASRFALRVRLATLSVLTRRDSLGLVWALAAIAGGAVFVAAAQLTQTHMTDQPPYSGTQDDTGRGTRPLHKITTTSSLR